MTLQRLLRRYRLAYLYGCVGADITQAKKYTRSEQAHCHSWRVGWHVLEQASTDEQRAFAYGYLTHLASDVLSHNHFVPIQLVVSYRAFAFRHVYWEARFDTLQNGAIRALVRELRTREFPACDALVRQAVERTLFSFDTDKRIFNTFIAIHDLDQWHRVLQRLTRKSRYELSSEVATIYNRVCCASIFETLDRGREASNQATDPTGLVALHTANRIRRGLRRLDRQGKLPPRIAQLLERLNQRGDLRQVLADTPGVPCGGSFVDDLKELEHALPARGRQTDRAHL